MALTSISITPQFGNSTVTAINCGTSVPGLSGTVDVSAFPNLQQFRCISNNITALSGYAQNSNLTIVNFFDNKVTGSIPSLSALTNLQQFMCNANQLTGPLPSLSGLTQLLVFKCSINNLTGPIPNLSANRSLIDFRVHDNNITGDIPSLSANSNLENFFAQYCSLSGDIPSLSANSNLVNFWVLSQTGLTKLTGFAGGSVSNTLESFQAQNNQLNQSSIDAILSAFDATTRTTGTRILNLAGTGNAAPSYTGGVTTTSAGTNFSRSGTLVTANVTGHGHPNGSLVTISGITPTAFQGTFVITAVNANQFQYTTQTSDTVTGTGTATMRRTTVATDGFRYYQNLAAVTRLGGFPWSVTIIFP